jgi:hypothetical protein
MDVLSIAASTRRACSTKNAGVLPFTTDYFGARTEALV